MKTDRREFLKGAAWMGAAAAVVGCSTTKGFGDGGSMATYADKPFKKLRVGIIGLGRGGAGVNGFNAIPGCELTAICDLNAARIKRTLDATAKAGRPAPKVYTGGPRSGRSSATTRMSISSTTRRRGSSMCRSPSTR